MGLDRLPSYVSSVYCNESGILLRANGGSAILFDLYRRNHSSVPAFLSYFEPGTGKGGIKDERVKVSVKKYSP